MARCKDHIARLAIAFAVGPTRADVASSDRRSVSSHAIAFHRLVLLVWVDWSPHPVALRRGLRGEAAGSVPHIAGRLVAIVYNLDAYAFHASLPLVGRNGQIGHANPVLRVVPLPCGLAVVRDDEHALAGCGFYGSFPLVSRFVLG